MSELYVKKCAKELSSEIINHFSNKVGYDNIGEYIFNGSQFLIFADRVSFFEKDSITDKTGFKYTINKSKMHNVNINSDIALVAVFNFRFNLFELRNVFVNNEPAVIVTISDAENFLHLEDSDIVDIDDIKKVVIMLDKDDGYFKTGELAVAMIINNKYFLTAIFYFDLLFDVNNIWPELTISIFELKDIEITPQSISNMVLWNAEYRAKKEKNNKRIQSIYKEFEIIEKSRMNLLFGCKN